MSISLIEKISESVEIKVLILSLYFQVYFVLSLHIALPMQLFNTIYLKTESINIDNSSLYLNNY